MTRLVRSSSTLALVLVALSGCRTWQPVSRAPTSPVWRDLPEAMRLTLEDGSSITLERPVIQFDQTIQSELGGPYVPLQDISAVEARRLNALRTSSFLLAHASALFLLISLIVDIQPHYRGL